MELTDKSISWDEILVALKTARNGKACGIDGIPTEAYKLVQTDIKMETSLSMCVYRIVNKVYESGISPELWKDRVVVPIYKKGDIMDPNNYCGILLISTLLKILTRLLANRVMSIALYITLYEGGMWVYALRRVCSPSNLPARGLSMTKDT
jgi:hypothetical protein